jgi:hypothetical protein
MTKGPKLHNAQQSLTDLIQSSTKVNIDMYANKTSHMCWEYALEVIIEMIILPCIHDIL